MTKTHTPTGQLAKAGMVAALYVAFTLINPLSFGAVQLRFSELFNNFSIFNKRYIWAVTLGCAIANLQSPLGIIDVIFGTLGTLVMTSLSYWATRNIRSEPLKLTICVIICTLMSWSVALELHYVSDLPFWATYLSIGIGEFISMTLGAVLVYFLSKAIDLTE